MKDVNNSVGFDPINIGQKLRDLRMEKGLSQAELADKVGVSSQQLRKFEDGEEQIAVSDLFELCDMLKANMSWFFDGRSETSCENRSNRVYDVFQPDTLKLAIIFDSISNQETRKKILDLIMSLSNE